MKTIFIFLFVLATTSLSFAQWSSNATINTPVITAVNQQNSQQIINDGSDGAILVYMDYNGTINERDIYAQRINASGVVQWGVAGVPICTIVANQQNPQLTTDGSGGAIMAWQDNRITSIPEIYVQRINSAGVVQWTADGISLGDGTIGGAFTQLISDGSGGAFVTWKNSNGIVSSIQVQHVDASGAILWATGGIAANNSTAPELPQIISDGAGGMILSWNQYVGAFPSGNHDIYAQRINAAGVLQWGASGTVICSNASPQTTTKLTTDGSNGAIICWQDYRAGGGLNNIYVQRVNASGIVQWTIDGIATAPAASSQLFARIMADGAGGAFITWNNNSTVYAQRMSSAGALQWGAGGKLVRPAPGAEPQIITDGSTGSMITWSNNNDVFAQRLDVNGNFLWAAAGVPVCTEASATQITPKMIASSSGTAIIVWVDSRNNAITETDLYASKLLANGTLASGTLPIGLLNFQYKKLNTAIQLHWQTSFEQNSLHFDIERSSDGIRFFSLAKLNAAANSQTIKDYYFTDSDPLNGMNYYRLRQVDMDGNFKNSEVLRVEIQKNNKLQLYPNPAFDQVQLVFSKPTQYTIVSVYNSSGQLVKKISIADGQTKQTVDISLLPKGEYMMRTNDEANGILKLMKQ